MATYTDSNGKRRELDITLTSAARVRKEFDGVDLMNLIHVGEVCGDFEKVLRIVHCLQAEDGSESFAEWDRSHKGEGYYRAVEAFQIACCECQPKRVADALRKMIRVNGTLIDRLVDEALREPLDLPMSDLSASPV